MFESAYDWFIGLFTGDEESSDSNHDGMSDDYSLGFDDGVDFATQFEIDD